MWESKIKRLMVSSQPKQKKKKKKFVETASQRKNLSMEVHSCRPSFIRKHKIGGSYTRLIWAKSETLSPK
jgi:hypothetical protein